MSAMRIGATALRVSDIDRCREFYTGAIGLREIEDPGVNADGADHDQVLLGAPGRDEALVSLIADPAAPPRPAGTTGLFHLAILVPSRADLARSLSRLTRYGRRLTGASDHLVSEAIYLDDPEGNGIEIYRDRPRSEWRQSESGELAMATLPLDVRSLLEETGDEEDPGPQVAAGTVIGHVHLNVADIGDSERFYTDRLGFEVMVRSYPGALFVGADGYHHHIGLNTWNGTGAPAPPPGSLGLDHFEIVVPGADDESLTDPSGNAVQLIDPFE